MTLLEIDDAVTGVDHSFPVRDDHDGLIRHGAQVVKKCLLRLFVEAAGRFIEKQYRAVGEDGARDGDALHLSFRQSRASFAEERIFFVVEFFDKRIGTGDLQCGADPTGVSRCFWIGKRDDLPDRAAH